MKRNALCTLAVLTTLGLGMAGSVMAQQDRYDRRGGPPMEMERDHDHGRHEGDRHDERGDRGDRGRGAGPYHNIHRGDRLPPEWRYRQYHVDRWREHELPAPPRGYVWVQMGPDYALVANSTGIVAQVVIR